jgi:hypothetical protein
MHPKAAIKLLVRELGYRSIINTMILPLLDGGLQKINAPTRSPTVTKTIKVSSLEKTQTDIVREVA